MSKNLEKIELFFTVADLPAHYFTMATTYPFAVIYEIDRKTKQLRKIGRTDKVNSLSPHFSESFVVEFLFEVKQHYVVKIFDWNSSVTSLDDESKHRFIGEAHFELANLLCSTSNVMISPLVNKDDHAHKTLGNLTIRAEAKSDSRDLLCVTFSASKLANKEGFFAKSDPFLVILRCNEDNSYTKVWESTTIMDTLDPKWAPVKISISKLCNGDIHRPLKIEIYDHEKSGKHVFMGVVTGLSVNSLISAGSSNHDVIEPDKQKKSGYKNSGVLHIGDVSIEHHASFAQYIKGGCEIGLHVAVDFTGSNGDPHRNDSLHFLTPGGERLNQYEDAIISVGNILEPYDNDKKYNVWGFGARLKTEDGYSATSEHAFPITNGGDEVRGVNGILEAYRSAVHNIMFSGPTLFTPILSTVSAITETLHCRQEKQKYIVLLILTDGAINDMETTVRTLIQASNIPLSVLIVGVGNEDFTAMKNLDSDKGLLSQGGLKATRDIVQFIPYRETIQEGTSVLAQQLLAEIPDQLISFMESHNIVPNKKA